jgi:hypothetical protein
LIRRTSGIDVAMEFSRCARLETAPQERTALCL